MYIYVYDCCKFPQTKNSLFFSHRAGIPFNFTFDMKPNTANVTVWAVMKTMWDRKPMPLRKRTGRTNNRSCT